MSELKSKARYASIPSENLVYGTACENYVRFHMIKFYTEKK